MVLSLSYTRCYCEENAYHAVEKSLEASSPFSAAYAVVVSSCNMPPRSEVVNEWVSSVPWRPFSSAASGEIGAWDYHVFAAVKTKKLKRWYVVDFDCNLAPPAAPSELGEWALYCVPLEYYMKEMFFFEESNTRLRFALDQVRFRLVKGEDYLCSFRSDRSHMLKNGVYNAPPPLSKPIQDFHATTSSELKEHYQGIEETLSPRHRKNNLVSFINMGNSMFPGSVVTRHDVVSCLSSN